METPTLTRTQWYLDFVTKLQKIQEEKGSLELEDYLNAAKGTE